MVRKPTEEEKEEIRRRYAKQYGLSPDEAVVLDDCPIAIFGYVSQSPGYIGRVAVVLSSYDPEQVSVVLLDDDHDEDHFKALQKEDALLEDYRVYCEAKKEIEEEPFSFDDWLAIEKGVQIGE